MALGLVMRRLRITDVVSPNTAYCCVLGMISLTLVNLLGLLGFLKWGCGAKGLGKWLVGTARGFAREVLVAALLLVAHSRGACMGRLNRVEESSDGSAATCLFVRSLDHGYFSAARGCWAQRRRFAHCLPTFLV